MSKDYFEYYCGAEGDQFSFIRIPKLMLFDAKFEDLSLGALMLYGLLLDRMSLSIRHGWIDENNHVYIRYKIKDIMDNLHLSENTATKYLNELENIGLVEKLKIGMGHIFLKLIYKMRSKCVHELSSLGEESKWDIEDELIEPFYRDMHRMYEFDGNIVEDNVIQPVIPSEFVYKLAKNTIDNYLDNCLKTKRIPFRNNEFNRSVFLSWND